MPTLTDCFVRAAVVKKRKGKNKEEKGSSESEFGKKRSKVKKKNEVQENARVFTYCSPCLKMPWTQNKRAEFKSKLFAEIIDAELEPLGREKSSCERKRYAEDAKSLLERFVRGWCSGVITEKW